MFKALGKMPVFLAVIIMVLLMMGGVVLGNGNALDSAASTAWAELSAIEQALADMSSRASNYLVIAGRIGLEGETVNALKQAQSSANAVASTSAQKLGKTGLGNILTSAEALDSAVMALDAEIRQAIQGIEKSSDAKIEEDTRSRAYDNWVDNRLGIAQRKAYNETVASVQEVYQSLPTSALLGGKVPPKFE